MNESRYIPLWFNWTSLNSEFIISVSSWNSLFKSLHPNKRNSCFSSLPTFQLSLFKHFLSPTMENAEDRSKFQKWVAHVTLYKSDDRKFYCQRSNWIPTCRQNTGSPPLLSIILALVTSLSFFLVNFSSKSSYMYYSTKQLDENPDTLNSLLQFRSDGSWVSILTVFSSFFYATEIQMYRECLK